MIYEEVILQKTSTPTPLQKRGELESKRKKGGFRLTTKSIIMKLKKYRLTNNE
jgi:hypothetical protein